MNASDGNGASPIWYAATARVLGHVVAALEQRPHRRPQRRPPQVAGHAQRLGEPAEGEDLGVHRRQVAGGEQVEDPGAVGGQQRGHRSACVRPVEQLRRLGELVVEVGLADDEGVVDDRGRRAERTGVVEAPGPVERRRPRALERATARRRSTARRPAGPRAAPRSTESPPGCAAMARSRSGAVTASSVR